MVLHPQSHLTVPSEHLLSLQVTTIEQTHRGNYCKELLLCTVPSSRWFVIICLHRLLKNLSFASLGSLHCASTSAGVVVPVLSLRPEDGDQQLDGEDIAWEDDGQVGEDGRGEADSDSLEFEVNDAEEEPEERRVRPLMPVCFKKIT